MRGNFTCKSKLEESLGFPREEGKRREEKSSPNDLAVFTRTYGRCLLSGLFFRRSGGEAAQSSLLPVKQLEAPVYLLERKGVGIDLLKCAACPGEQRWSQQQGGQAERNRGDAEGMLPRRNCACTGNSQVLLQNWFWGGGCIKRRQRKCRAKLVAGRVPAVLFSKPLLGILTLNRVKEENVMRRFPVRTTQSSG